MNDADFAQIYALLCSGAAALIDKIESCTDQQLLRVIARNRVLESDCVRLRLKAAHRVARFPDQSTSGLQPVQRQAEGTTP